MQARHLLEALRAGDRFQVARAVSIEIGHVMAAGGRPTRREQELVRTAEALSEREGSQEARAYFSGSLGVGLFQRGLWKRAREKLAIATATAYGHAGIETSRLFEVYAANFIGEMAEARRRIQRLCAQAEDHGDLYTSVNLQTSISITLALGAGDPAKARQERDRGMARWTQDGFHVQHWQATVYGSDIDVYEGRPAEAYDQLMAKMPVLKKSLLLHSAFIRTMTGFVRARLAIARIDARPDEKAVRVAEALAMVRKLRKEHDPWAGALAELITGVAENALGRRDAAIAAMRRGVAACEAIDMIVYAVPARFRLGELVGGEEGDALVKAARETLLAQGTRDPARWVALYFPGKWTA
jgi:hypothetical protein